MGTIRNVGVSALTKNLADELGQHGINVTAVHPGDTLTERTAALVHDRAKRRGTTEAEVRAEFNAGNSTAHMITAQEVADVVVFLASPRSVAINGDTVGVGGGMQGAIHY
jgi:NAD(P)-dependent dehydrogenase (short-subunit alcohol dehydrogenase family)